MTVPMTGAAGAPGSGGGAGIPAAETGAAGTAPDPGSTGAAGSSAGAAGGPVGGAAGTGAAGTGGAAGTVGAAGTGGAAGAAGTGGAAGATQTGGTDAGTVDATPEAPPAVPYSAATWKPTASITAAGNADVPTNAFDGKIATRWTTGKNQTGDEWFELDLGQAVSVGRVVLDDTTNPQDFPVAFTLETSTNGMTFKTAETGHGSTVTDIELPAPVSARYLRIKQTGMTPTGGSWWSIDEIEVYP